MIKQIKVSCLYTPYFMKCLWKHMVKHTLDFYIDEQDYKWELSQVEFALVSAYGEFPTVGML